MSGLARAAEAAEEEIPLFDQILNKITEIVFYPITIGDVTILPIVVWLVFAALFFTVYLGFLNIRGFTHAIDLVRGRYSKPEDAGECRTSRRSRPQSPERWAWATSLVSPWPSPWAGPAPPSG